MYSSVIKIAILFIKAVLLDIEVPSPGLIKPVVDEPTTEADPTSFSVITKSIFFLFKDLYFLL